MLDFNFQIPRELELFAQVVAELQKAEATFRIVKHAHGYGAAIVISEEEAR